jgi:hypothetical protein
MAASGDRAERAFTNVEPETGWWPAAWKPGGRPNWPSSPTPKRHWPPHKATSAPAPAHDPLRALAADLPRLRDSPTTSHRYRKRLLGSLIADITLLPATDDDNVRIGVRWHTGATDELTALRHGPGRTPAGALELVRRYGATHTSGHLQLAHQKSSTSTPPDPPETCGRRHCQSRGSRGALES